MLTGLLLMLTVQVPGDSLTLAQALAQARAARGPEVVAATQVVEARGALRTAGAIPNPSVSYSRSDAVPTHHLIVDQPLDWLIRRGTDRAAARAGLTRARADSAQTVSGLVGFSTYIGTVTAASDWGAPVERKRVRPAPPGSVEALFHSLAVPDLLLPMRGREPVAAALRESRLERAIGVIYLPKTERLSHYFKARLPEQFDAMIHFDETRAVEPLDLTPGWATGEPPETYPFGE
jgi:erythromycin esterase